MPELLQTSPEVTCELCRLYRVSMVDSDTPIRPLTHIVCVKQAMHAYTMNQLMPFIHCAQSGLHDNQP